MNFPEFRTLAERSKPDDSVVQDEFQDSKLESPGWIRKYLDLADLAIRRSRDFEDWDCEADADADAA